MTEVHLVVPAGIDDPGRPSGGNVYDQRACRGLRSLGWTVSEHAARGGWPDPEPGERAGLAAALAAMPDDAVVLIDGLVASAVPEVLVSEAARLRLVVLLHMPVAEPSGLLALSAARAVVVTSEWTRTWVRENTGMAADRVQVVPPGVDPAEPADGTESGGHLLCVAAVTPLKGQDVLLAALEEISDLSWRCVCAGALDVDPGFAGALLRRRDDAGLGDRVILAGALAGEDLDRAYVQADVLVLPSRVESYGMVIAEALAHGLPVIACDVGGVSQALGHAADGARPGVLVPVDDASALAHALRGWLGDREQRGRLREAARSRGRTLLGWSQASRELAGVLSGVARSAEGIPSSPPAV